MAKKDEIKELKEELAVVKQQLSTKQEKPQQDPGNAVFVIVMGIILAIILFYVVLVVFDTPAEYYDTGTGTYTTGSSSGCSPGYCSSNGRCCPSNYRYYCDGDCYASQQDALSVGGARCSTYRIVC